MALDDDDEAFLNDLLETLQDREAEPALAPPTYCQFDASPLSVGIRGNFWSETDGDEPCDSPLQPVHEPGSVKKGGPDNETWNELLKRFCVKGDESIVDTLLDDFVQSGRDASYLIDALATADLAAALDDVTAASPSEDSFSGLSGASAGSVSRARNAIAGAVALGTSAELCCDDIAARSSVARADVVARIAEMEDPGVTRAFMRRILLGVRHRYLDEATGCGSALANTSTELPEEDEEGEEDRGGQTSRSIGTPSVMTVKDSPSLRSCASNGSMFLSDYD